MCILIRLSYFDRAPRDHLFERQQNYCRKKTLDVYLVICARTTTIKCIVRCHSIFSIHRMTDGKRCEKKQLQQHCVTLLHDVRCQYMLEAVDVAYAALHCFFFFSSPRGQSRVFFVANSMSLCCARMSSGNQINKDFLKSDAIKSIMKTMGCYAWFLYFLAWKLIATSERGSTSCAISRFKSIIILCHIFFAFFMTLCDCRLCNSATFLFFFFVCCARSWEFILFNHMLFVSFVRNSKSDNSIY